MKTMNIHGTLNGYLCDLKVQYFDNDLERQQSDSLDTARDLLRKTLIHLDGTFNADKDLYKQIQSYLGEKDEDDQDSSRSE